MAERPKGDDMRDIKFRAWHYESGNPMYKPYMQYSSSTFDLPLFWRHVADEPCSVEVMQYTGLKDKNGVEIYEGDIVKQFFGKHYWIYEIKELGGQFGNMLFAITRKNNCTVDDESDRYTFKEQIVDGMSRNYVPSGKDCEVIGNIYENPELLEK